ncbi:MAG: hypothetical protein ACON4W_05870 [Parvibaculales bacterium]
MNSNMALWQKRQLVDNKQPKNRFSFICGVSPISPQMDGTSGALKKTEVRPTDRPDVSRHGTLEGHVQKIAQNTTQEENLPPYYQTMIEINNPRFSKSEEEMEIVPGSPVMVDIIGNKRTIMSYILTPLERAAGRAFREK